VDIAEKIRTIFGQMPSESTRPELMTSCSPIPTFPFTACVSLPAEKRSRHESRADEPSSDEILSIAFAGSSM
jgi:hypothetical protein